MLSYLFGGTGSNPVVDVVSLFCFSTGAILIVYFVLFYESIVEKTTTAFTKAGVPFDYFIVNL